MRGPTSGGRSGEVAAVTASVDVLISKPIIEDDPGVLGRVDYRIKSGSSDEKWTVTAPVLIATLFPEMRTNGRYAPYYYYGISYERRHNLLIHFTTKRDTFGS